LTVAQLCPLHSNLGEKRHYYKLFHEVKLIIQLGRAIIPLYKSKEPVASGKTNITMEKHPFLTGDTSTHMVDFPASYVSLPECSPLFHCLPSLYQLRREPPTSTNNRSHRIHVWYIYLHLAKIYGKCRQIYVQTWILWDLNHCFTS